MARMERVAVWSLMSGGGGGLDVFTVSRLPPGALRGAGAARLALRIARSLAAH